MRVAPPPPPPSPRNFHHAAVLTSDLERSTRFYRDLVGLTERARHFEPDGSLRSVWLDLGAGFLAIERATLRAAETSAGAAGWHCFVFAIDPRERDTLRAGLVAAGYPIERETGFTFYVRDPDGALVGFSHHPRATVEPSVR